VIGADVNPRTKHELAVRLDRLKKVNRSKGLPATIATRGMARPMMRDRRDREVVSEPTFPFACEHMRKRSFRATSRITIPNSAIGNSK